MGQLTDRNEDMHITAPQWEWKWNVNTIAVLVGFAAGFVAWGYTISELRTGRATNAENISRLDVRMTNIEATSRVLENHEQRLTFVEREARDAATNSRAMQETMGKMATDMAVVKEVLLRLESSQNGSRSSRP